MIIEQSRSPEEALKQRHFRRRGIPRREFRANEIVIDYCSLKHGSRRITAWLGLIRAMPRSGEGTVVLFPVKKEERERERKEDIEHLVPPPVNRRIAPLCSIWPRDPVTPYFLAAFGSMERASTLMEFLGLWSSRRNFEGAPRYDS